LHFLPKYTTCPKPSIVISRARRIGEEVLSHALDTVPDDRRGYLEDAISRAPEIEPSPKFDQLQAKE